MNSADHGANQIGANRCRANPCYASQRSASLRSSSRHRASSGANHLGYCHANRDRDRSTVHDRYRHGLCSGRAPGFRHAPGFRFVPGFRFASYCSGPMTCRQNDPTTSPHERIPKGAKKRIETS